MKIAVEGCCHGELEKVYETLQYIERRDNIKVDLLLICGDFQAVRNQSDLQAMAVPPKFQCMNTFYKYYSGEVKAPVLTVIIGGNHEASNYLQELPYGGWIAPNIYYLGYAGVVQFGGLRIGGLSGIFKGRDYHRGHYEHPPYNEDTKRSVYHVRNLDVFKLKQCKRDIDIFLSHDWPRGIYNYGDVNTLLRQKPYFRDEVRNGTLGSPAAEDLLFALKPAHWFAAHLHCKFAACVQHKVAKNSPAKTTKFLALDKCLPNRGFLQVLDFPRRAGSALQLELDPEWLCILKSTNHLHSFTKSPIYMPTPGRGQKFDFTPTEAEIKQLIADFQGMFTVPKNFTRTAPTYRPPGTHLSKGLLRKLQRAIPAPQITINPQTSLLCGMLDLTDPFAVFSGKQIHKSAECQLLVPKMMTEVAVDDENSDVPSFIDTTMDTTLETSQECGLSATTNPDEISLDDIEDSDDGKSQSDSNAVSSDMGTGSSPEMASGSSGVDTEMNISVVGGNIKVLSGGDANVLNRLCETNVQSPMAKFGPKNASTPRAVRTKLVLSAPSSTPIKIDSMTHGRKRSNDDGYDEPETSDTSLAGPSKPKKFKRRNQNFYQSSGNKEN